MSIAIGALVSAIAPKLMDVVDKAVEDKDTALKLKADISAQLLANDSEFTKAASGVIIAEAEGESWLQRNWRPLLMIWFSVLIGAYWFGFVPINMPLSVVESLFSLVQIGVGGYVVGRTGEKIAATLAPVLGAGKGKP